MAPTLEVLPSLSRMASNPCVELFDHPYGLGERDVGNGPFQDSSVGVLFGNIPCGREKDKLIVHREP